MANDKPGRGGRRKGAGRPPKAEENRIQKSVNLTPTVWAFIHQQIGDSESDALERILRSHPLFQAPDKESA